MSIEGENDFESTEQANEEIIEVEQVDNTAQGTSIDWDIVREYSFKTTNVLSILLGYLGVFVILSYPLFHIINAIFKTDKFFEGLPLGYKTMVTLSKDIPISPEIVMIVFGIIYAVIGFKLCIWLSERYDISARITSILSGALFWYCMVDKTANDLLLQGINVITWFILIVLVVIPFTLFFIYTLITGGRSSAPSAFLKSYYNGILKIFNR